MKTEKESLFHTYQIDKCIRTTGKSSFYYGFHIRMQKEILIWESLEEPIGNFSETEEMTCFPYIIDIQKDDHASYIIMNYVKGIFFEDYLRQGRVFSDKELLRIGLDACHIIQELNNRKLSGAGLWSLDNVMLTPDFRLCFLDRKAFEKKDAVSDVRRDNIRAALNFLRSICTGVDTVFHEIIKKDYSSVRSLKKSLLNIAKRTEEYKRMARRHRRFCAAVFLLFLGSAFFCMRNGLLYKQEVLLQQGILAMEREEYASAIANFQDVLGIDESNMEVRQYIAECYRLEGNIEKAEEYFQKNLDEFQDDYSLGRLNQILEDKALSAYQDQDYNQAVEYYQKLEEKSPGIGFEEMLLNLYLKTNDFENVKKIISTLQGEENIDAELTSRINSLEEMIQQSEALAPQYADIAGMIEQEDWLGLKDKFESAEYLELCSSYGGDVYCGYSDGKFVKLYKNGAVYLGEMEQDERSGNGELVLLGRNTDNILFFEGEWDEDLPNGSGVQKAVILSYLEEGREMEVSIAGNYKNGYSDGEMKQTVYENTGSEIRVIKTAIYTSDMGYMEPVDVPGAETYYGGDYVAAVFDNGDFRYTHYGHIDSVSGLGLGECVLTFDRSYVEE